jgi:hypothetical protein
MRYFSADFQGVVSAECAVAGAPASGPAEGCRAKVTKMAKKNHKAFSRCFAAFARNGSFAGPETGAPSQALTGS